MCREHSQRIAFEMLRVWRSRNHSRSTKDELKAMLQRALESVVPAETQAVEALNTDASQVQVDAQVRGSAVVTQVTDEVVKSQWDLS
jgi:plasmid stability protein